ncbi:MAG: hypothetical protein HYU60_06185 [Magnetospirillum sp.]|nr:hypothetical protein [Magnetospirillum sp.]
MRAIKALVIFMGVLLFAGLGLLVYAMSTKARQAGTPTAPPAGTAAEFGRVEVTVPAGARIEQMVAAGERVVLRLSGTGPERLLVLDPAAGRLVGSFELAPQPQAR